MKVNWAIWVLWAGMSVAAPAHALTDEPYLAPGQFDTLLLLAPPPSSAEQIQQDMKSVLTAQKECTAAQVKRAEDAKTDFAAFASVLGPGFTEKNLPVTTAFLRKVTKETFAQVRLAKDCWERPRPFVVSTDVHPIYAVKPDAAATNVAPRGAGSPCKPLDKPVFSYSYPSGNANFGTATAIVLAAMVPEKRDAIFLRGWEFGQNPFIAGSHFPSDLEGGRILATASVAVMMQNPAFKADFSAARTELRKALGLAS